jgi:DNA-binding NarL/FixJ family response regulator
MNILIADDKPHMRRTIRTMLQAHGWDVCAEAEDGVQAITRAKQCKPDAIVLDFAMPELNGIEAARQIIKALPEVPIVLLTLYDSALVQKEASRVGIQRVISKSDGSMLISVIEEAFAQIHQQVA